MRFSYATSLSALVSVAVASSIHSKSLLQRTSHIGNPLAKRRDGQFSYYDAGLGACGGTNGEGDFIVALSASLWDGGSHCGQQVTINVGGRSATATIVDECPGCPPGQLDCTKGLFRHLSGGSLDAGILHGSWDFGGGGGGGGGGNNDDDKKKEEDDKAKKQQEEEDKQKAEQKKKDDEAAQQKKEEDDKKKAAAASSSSVAAAKSSSAAAAAKSSSKAQAAASSSSAAAAKATAVDGSAQFLGNANGAMVMFAHMAIAGYKA
ncbi:RlpA-like double-psi beta-barrel-protein domain-containing protein-containing protein [Flagelloscypha sp. PMI_526]|nr:RlpA-like double-psi beta-barrel-protein domain-containing protein-containing protein [Flagelloscypha sp. PMI_526]